ncbi:Amino acid permease [Balamuthia mandrillaris]
MTLFNSSSSSDPSLPSTLTTTTTLASPSSCETSLLLPRRRSTVSASGSFTSSPLRYLLRSVTRTKSIEQAVAEERAEREAEAAGHNNKAAGLRKALSVWDLIAYGLGASVGAGIFVITGQAAALHAGPSVVLSFLIAGIACVLSALCYAEFAARLPVAGSAYSYTYTSQGELLAWLIGWDLTLEYGISAATVARGWGGIFESMLQQWGVNVESKWLAGFPVVTVGGDAFVLNASPISAVLILLCTIVLALGIKESSRLNLFATVLNIGTIIFIIIAGSFYIDTDNYTPFFPQGPSGMFYGAAQVFFSFIGFDCITSLAEESSRPQRDLPLSILGSLSIATILYCAVATVLVGLIPTALLKGVANPMAAAFAYVGLGWTSKLVTILMLVIVCITTLCCLLGQPRIYYRMARDGLLWPAFGTINKRFQTPLFSTIFTGIFVALIAFFIDIVTLGDMISIGTLLAFTLVCGSTIVQRYTSKKEDATTLLLNRRNKFSRFFNKRQLVLFLVLTLTFGVFLVSVLLKELPSDLTLQLSLCIPIGVLLVVLPFVVLCLLRSEDVPKTFHCPFMPVVPCLGIAVNVYLMVGLDWLSWLRLAGWLLIGLVIYLCYGMQHSKLAQTEEVVMVSSASPKKYVINADDGEAGSYPPSALSSSESEEEEEERKKGFLKMKLDNLF